MSNFGDPRHPNPVMDQQRMMYNHNPAGFMPQHGRNPYSMGDYNNYEMHRMNSAMMNTRQGDMSSAAMSGSYYNSTVPEMAHMSSGVSGNVHSHSSHMGHQGSHSQAAAHSPSPSHSAGHTQLVSHPGVHSQLTGYGQPTAHIGMQPQQSSVQHGPTSHVVRHGHPPSHNPPSSQGQSNSHVPRQAGSYARAVSNAQLQQQHQAPGQHLNPALHRAPCPPGPAGASRHVGPAAMPCVSHASGDGISQAVRNSNQVRARLLIYTCIRY